MNIRNPFDEDDEFEDDTTEPLLEDILLDVYGISRPTKYVATTKTPKKKDIQEIKEKFKQRKKNKLDGIVIPFTEAVFYKYLDHMDNTSGKIILDPCEIIDIKQVSAPNYLSITVLLLQNYDYILNKIKYARGRLGFMVPDRNNANKSKIFTLEGKVDFITEKDNTFNFSGRNIYSNLYMYYSVLKENMLAEKIKQEEEEKKKNRILTRRIHFD